MLILLMRHGLAVDEVPGLGDVARWLSAKGRKVTRQVARRIAKTGKYRPRTIWTSPLVRAVQTAEILAVKTRFKGEVVVIPELAPGHDPRDVIPLLTAADVEGPIALVGHEPSLSLLAAALVDHGAGGFKKSGVLGISWTNGVGEVAFALQPRDLGKAKKAKKAPKVPTAEEPEGNSKPEKRVKRDKGAKAEPIDEGGEP